jgi:heterodisulfide reductase subunit A-like polyferredoxin
MNRALIGVMSDDIMEETAAIGFARSLGLQHQAHEAVIGVGIVVEATGWRSTKAHHSTNVGFGFAKLAGLANLAH